MHIKSSTHASASVALRVLIVVPWHCSPRRRYYEGGKTSKSAVLGHSTIPNSRGEPLSAPLSGSMISSGSIAPRMKLVRRASRDLSADVQVRILGHWKGAHHASLSFAVVALGLSTLRNVCISPTTNVVDCCCRCTLSSLLCSGFQNTAGCRWGCKHNSPVTVKSHGACEFNVRFRAPLARGGYGQGAFRYSFRQPLT